MGSSQAGLSREQRVPPRVVAQVRGAELVLCHVRELVNAQLQQQRSRQGPSSAPEAERMWRLRALEAISPISPLTNNRTRSCMCA